MTSTRTSAVVAGERPKTGETVSGSLRELWELSWQVNAVKGAYKAFPRTGLPRKKKKEEGGE